MTAIRLAIMAVAGLATVAAWGLAALAGGYIVTTGAVWALRSQGVLP